MRSRVQNAGGDRGIFKDRLSSDLSTDSNCWESVCALTRDDRRVSGVTGRRWHYSTLGCKASSGLSALVSDLPCSK